MVKQEAGCIKTVQLVYEGQVNHSMEEKLAEAQEVRELHQTEGREAGNILARKYGFSSVYHAGAVIRRSKFEQIRTVTLNAYRIGDLSFVAAPYEMFAAHGTYIKENSPFPMTFVVSCCNGANSYLPTIQAYNYGCYESHNSNFVPGTGEELAEKFVSLLKQLQ